MDPGGLENTEISSKIKAFGVLSFFGREHGMADGEILEGFVGIISVFVDLFLKTTET